MSLFTFHAIDTKPIVTELKRLNDLFTIYLRVAHDHVVTVPQPLASSDEADSVSYASDEALAKQEMLEEVQKVTAIADDIEKKEAD